MQTKKELQERIKKINDIMENMEIKNSGEKYARLNYEAILCEIRIKKGWYKKV